MSSNFQNLQELYAGNRLGIESGKLNEIGDQGAIALAGSPHLANLTDIDLQFTDVGDEGFEALFTSEHLQKLASVTAWGTRLTQEGWVKVKTISAAKNYTPWIHTDFDERTIEY